MWVFWSRVGLLFKGNSKENIAGWPIGGATDRSTLDIRWVFFTHRSSPPDRPVSRFFCLISTAHILQTVCSCGGAERAFSTARRRRLAARAARGEITKRTRGYGGSCKRECARGRLRARLCLEKGDDARATRSSRETMNTQGVGAMVASGAVRPPRVSRAAHLGFFFPAAGCPRGTFTYPLDAAGSLACGASSRAAPIVRSSRGASH